MDFEKRLRKEIEEIKIIDTHEHIEPEEERIKRKIDFFHWFPHYTSSDLISAGMSPGALQKCRNTNIPLEERWAEFALFWECIRTTGYGKALLVAAKDLHGIDDINKKTCAKLSEKISDANKKGLYHFVLREKGKIDVSLCPEEVNNFNKLDRDFFTPVMQADEFIGIQDKDSINALEKSFGRKINSPDDVTGIMEFSVKKAEKEGAAGVKCGFAYARTLKFENADSAAAKSVFGKIIKKEPVDAGPLQDYLIHRLLEILAKQNLPFQVHTGMREGNGNRIAGFNPVHLTNLFLKYPEVRFDVFHAGYPYYSELAVLAKNFPNVYADMCRMYVVTPVASKRILHEWIDTIPNNKIFGFGGDYVFIEGAYAHSQIAREIIFQVIIEKFKRKWISGDEALMLARKLLRDNAKAFFKL
jgi:uncharacterized protein